MVIATGFFDGVHIGHRLVISQLVKAAKARGEESLIVTFWPHPRNVLQLGARTFRLLSSLKEKEEMLLSLGVDRIEVIPFTRDFGALTTEEYLRDYIMDKFGGTAIVLGYDNRMGSDSLSTEDVRRTAVALGLDVIQSDKVESPSGIAMSSTKIRNFISEGQVVEAAGMLGPESGLEGLWAFLQRICSCMNL